jgi:hypothetical protein
VSYVKIPTIEEIKKMSIGEVTSIAKATKEKIIQS